MSHPAQKIPTTEQVRRLYNLLIDLLNGRVDKITISKNKDGVIFVDKITYDKL